MGGDFKKILQLKFHELQMLTEYEEYVAELEYQTKKLNDNSKKNNLL